MSLQDRNRVEAGPQSPASLAFGGSGRSSTPPQEGPDPRIFSCQHAVFRNCRQLLLAGRSTLWLHRNQSYYVLADHISQQAYLVIGSRAGALEADLKRLGYGLEQNDGARSARRSADMALETCLRRYFWMSPLEKDAMQSIETGRP